MKYKIFCGCALFAFVVATTPCANENVPCQASAASPTCSKIFLPATRQATSSFWRKENARRREKVGGAASKEGRVFGTRRKSQQNRSRVSGVYVENVLMAATIFSTPTKTR